MKVDKRLDELRNYMDSKKIDLSIITSPDNQFYLSGFKALTYSRPITLMLEKQEIKLSVPALEEIHAKEESNVDEIFVYYEHPEGAHKGTHPYHHVGKKLSKYKPGSKVGVDKAHTASQLVDYIENLNFEVIDISKKIAEMRYIKDKAELQLIEKAGELVNLGVSESLKVCKEGITEMEMDAKGNTAIFKETAKRYPKATLDFMVMSPSGVERTVMPHVFSNTRELKKGDIVIHSRQVALNGYRAELERTVILGEMTDNQKKAFDAAIEAQQIAIDFIKPGTTAAEVDEVARRLLKQKGFGDYAINRMGHGIGISLHEEPSLRFDNDLMLQEGMVFTIEPGIYIPGVGGFRHSDTVILTKDGRKLITEYPREMEQLNF